MSYDEHLISMAGGDGDQLADIERRRRVAMDYPGMVTIEQSQSDVPALLAIVREQAATIELVRAEADSFDELASHASYNGTEAEMETWLSAASHVRAALEPKP